MFGKREVEKNKRSSLSTKAVIITGSTPTLPSSLFSGTILIGEEHKIKSLYLQKLSVPTTIKERKRGRELMLYV